MVINNLFIVIPTRHELRCLLFIIIVILITFLSLSHFLLCSGDTAKCNFQVCRIYLNIFFSSQNLIFHRISSFGLTYMVYVRRKYRCYNCDFIVPLDCLCLHATKIIFCNVIISLFSEYFCRVTISCAFTIFIFFIAFSIIFSNVYLIFQVVSCQFYFL